MRRTLKLAGTLLAIAVVLIGLNEAGVFGFKPPFDKLLTEIGVALLAVGLIHFLDHLTLIPETAKAIEEQTKEVFKKEIANVTDKTDAALKNATEGLTTEVRAAIADASSFIVGDVTQKTTQALDEARDSLLSSSREASEVLQRQVESIQVMEESNLIAIFPSRSSAASAIRSAIDSSSEVRLMGISLNEFFRSDQSSFRKAWQDLVEAIRLGHKQARILLIDPYCHGAVLRSYSETAHTEMVTGRLETDVLDAARHLWQIRKKLGRNIQRLHVHLYQLPPTAFLCHLDSTTFVQHYHFWRERLAGSPVPLLQYRKLDPGQPGPCIHAEMEQHFNFIWDFASIDLEDFLPTPSRGLEWGSHAAGMDSVFIDRSRPNNRMRDEIKNSNRIWIQGITLKAFFTEGSQLSNKLREKISEADEKTDIRIMLLDPDCDQAKERAYREYQLSFDSKLPFDEFSQHYYQRSKLVSDLGETISRIKRMIATLSGAKPAVRVEARKYRTAPHMFVLIGDRSAFVEQYSYGKIAGESSALQGETVILGSDMPLIEYKQQIDPIYGRMIGEIRGREDADSQQLRPQPYPLLKNHFEYAWSRAIPI